MVPAALSLVFKVLTIFGPSPDFLFINPQLDGLTEAVEPNVKMVRSFCCFTCLGQQKSEIESDDTDQNVNIKSHLSLGASSRYSLSLCLLHSE